MPTDLLSLPGHCFTRIALVRSDEHHLPTSVGVGGRKRYLFWTLRLLGHRVIKWAADEARHSVVEGTVKRVAALGDLAWLEALLEGAEQEEMDEGLEMASVMGNLPCAEMLLAQGADIHAWNDLALRVAAQYGHVEVTRLLLGAGAHIHAGDDLALCNAAQNGHEEVTRIFMEHLVQL